MIEEMQKASVLVLDSHRHEAVKQMREAGVLHVEAQPEESEELTRLYQSRQLFQRALGALPSSDEAKSKDEVKDRLPEPDPDAPVPPTVNEEQKATLRRATAIANEAVEVRDEVRGLEETHEQVLRERNNIAPWGDFDPQEVESLRQKGVHVHFHTLSPKEFRRRQPENAQVIAETSSLVYFVTITVDGAEGGPAAGGQAEGGAADAHGEGPQRDATRGETASEGHTLPTVAPPQRSLSTLEEERGRLKTQMSEKRERLAELAAFRDELESGIEQLKEDIRFHEVKWGMETEDQLAYLTGYVPSSEVDTLKKAASKNGWGLLLREPAPEDPVPTRLKNKKPIRIVQPVFDFLGTTPGYREMDISAWFLIFFSVFVAIIIGDAGYGALILGTSGYFLVRSARKSGEIPLGTVLFTVLGASTVIWGAITGTWFGYEPIGESPLLSWMVIEPIDSFNPRSRDVVQWICFILAAAHLSIAHLWNFFLELRSKPWYRAFAQLGWLAVLVGLYYLVLNLVLGQPLQMFGVYSILAGLGVVLLFSQHQEGDSFFKGVGRGLNGINTFTILLDGISAFSDVVSYLRLFAVGLATVEIAKSFNSMAAGMMDVGAAGIVGAILVLFLGHSINLIMAALSVVVHGIRLNLLEFTRHLGMEWSGIPYRPFRRGQHAS